MLGPECNSFIDATMIGDERMYNVLKIILEQPKLRSLLNSWELCLPNMCLILGEQFSLLMNAQMFTNA